MGTSWRNAFASGRLGTVQEFHLSRPNTYLPVRPRRSGFLIKSQHLPLMSSATRVLDSPREKKMVEYDLYSLRFGPWTTSRGTSEEKNKSFPRSRFPSAKRDHAVPCCVIRAGNRTIICIMVLAFVERTDSITEAERSGFQFTVLFERDMWSRPRRPTGRWEFTQAVSTRPALHVSEE